MIQKLVTLIFVILPIYFVRSKLCPENQQWDHICDKCISRCAIDGAECFKTGRICIIPEKTEKSNQTFDCGEAPESNQTLDIVENKYIFSKESGKDQEELDDCFQIKFKPEKTVKLVVDAKVTESGLQEPANSTATTITVSVSESKNGNGKLLLLIIGVTAIIILLAILCYTIKKCR